MIPNPSMQNILELFGNLESIADPTMRPDIKGAGTQRDASTCPRVPAAGSGTSAQTEYPARAHPSAPFLPGVF